MTEETTTIGARAVVFAPHHADPDVRVRRTIDVLRNSFADVAVFWDREYPGHRFQGQIQSTTGEDHLQPKPARLLRSAVGLSGLGPQLRRSIAGADLIYIHASAIEGLIYATEGRRCNRSARVVFDYHDSIAYELFYQLKKLSLIRLFPPVWAVYRRALPFLARSVDGVVGISENQLEDLKQLTGREMPTAIVPNVRHFSDCVRASAASRDDGSLSLVWLGNVSRGRDLERIAHWAERVRGATRLHVFGEIVEESVAAAVKETLGERVVFYGRYQGDEGIARQLPHNPVGIFLGWDDPCKIGINAIASPNKYFTYMNLEIPVILDRSLVGLAKDVEQFQAGLAIEDGEQFVAAVEQIEAGYAVFSEGMRSLKDSYRAFVPEDVLRRFLSDISAAPHSTRQARHV
jgi:hypothetical protein